MFMTGRPGGGGMENMCYRILLAAACVDESDHLALVNAWDEEAAFTSVAGYAGPSSSLQTTPGGPVLLSGVQSGVLHLLGLISGLHREGRGIPMSSFEVEMDLLPSRRLRLSNSCPSSPVPARWPALGRGAYTCMCVVCAWCMCC